MLTHRHRTNIPTYLGYAVLGVCAWLILALLAPADYRDYAAGARAWVHGASRLYDAQAPTFWYAPWALVVLAPLAALPDRFGQATLNLLSLISMVWAVNSLSAKSVKRATLLALITPYTAAILLLGQWDGLLLGGAALGWLALAQRRPWLLGLALIILTSKPTNVLLVICVLLWAAWRWSFHEWIRVLALPALALMLACVACGVDWPLRYVQFVRTIPPAGYNVSLWQSGFGLLVAAVAIGTLLRSVYRKSVSQTTIALALVVSLAVSPYVVPYHYVNTIPFLALRAQRDWRSGLALWALGLIAFICFVVRWTDVPLVIYLLASVVLHAYDERVVNASV